MHLPSVYRQIKSLSRAVSLVRRRPGGIPALAQAMFGLDHFQPGQHRLGTLCVGLAVKSGIRRAPTGCCGEIPTAAQYYTYSDTGQRRDFWPT